MLDEIALHIDCDAVVPTRSGLREQRQRRQLVDHGLQRGIRIQDPALAIQRVDGVGPPKTVGQPRGMRHQLAHGHFAIGILEPQFAVRPVADMHLEVGERRNVLRDRVAETPLPFLVKHHQGHPGDRFGHRIESED